LAKFTSGGGGVRTGERSTLIGQEVIRQDVIAQDVIAQEQCRLHSGAVGAARVRDRLLR
jgi:hypothetical protein